MLKKFWQFIVQSAKFPPMTDKTLNERSQNILGHLVDLYSQTGQPVGSKALMQVADLNVSSATIRNVMADLQKKGMLAMPHTSAGRVPTEEGFRYYAKSIVRAEEVVDEAAKNAIAAKVKAGGDNKKLIQDVSDLLGELTSCTAMVTAPKFDPTPLEQIEFIRLSGDRVLAVIVTADGKIENRVVDVPSFISVEELNEASAHMKKIIVGQTLDKAREELVSHLAEQKGRINEVMDQMMQAAELWGEAPATDSALVVAGSTNLFQYPELVRERLQGLIKMFEEKRLIMALMEEVQKGKGVQVFVGHDSPLEDCSLVASSYEVPGKKVLGTLGVIGPMRMNYKQTIGLVDYTAKLLGEALSREEK